MRIGFAGSPEFADTILSALIDAKLNIVRVLTQPPRPYGRGKKVRPTPVNTQADLVGIECVTPTTLRGQEHLVSDLDILVVAAYGLILPSSFLNTPRYGSVNAHASLLPRWRGASPIEHAILHLDERTGVSLMQITKGLDAGPVYESRSIPISCSDTAESITVKLATLAGDMMVKFIQKLHEGKAGQPVPQAASEAVYAPRLTTADARIDWKKDAVHVHAQIRAFQGRSSVWTTVGDVRIKVLEAQICDGCFEPGLLYASKAGVIVGCGSQGLNLKIVQLNLGKGKPLPIKAAMNGYRQIFANGIRWEYP